MKSLNVKIRDWVLNNWIWFCIFTISIFGVFYGLADMDYYWQKDLGKAIVKDFNFNSCYNQVWGNKGVGVYYDHEWLTNVIFYLFSLIPYKPLIWLKLFICILTGIETIRFLKEFKLNENLSFKVYAVFLLYAINILVFCKIKAYSLSVLLFMEEIILIERYKSSDTNSLKYIVRLGILCVLWTNIHSGSMPLFFVVAGVYWLFCFRTKKLLLQGVVIAFTTLINPYGYKLILFNFIHNFDKTMKSIILDWKGMDAKFEIGAICALIILMFIFLVTKQLKLHLPHFILSLLLIYMSFCSLRHIIYLIPLLYLYIIYFDVSIEYNIHSSRLNVLTFNIILAILVIFNTLFSCNYKDYSCNFVDSKLNYLIDTTIDADSTGLFNEHDFISMTNYGKKNFITGAYPLIAQRYKDACVLLKHGTYSQISDIIDYYKLDKFIFNKYNSDVTYYKLVNPLYDYLVNSSEYKCLYDSDKLVYFIRKGGK